MNEKFSDCDWHHEENKKLHRTEFYKRSDNSLVVRRGQPIRFTARLNRPFDAETDKISLNSQFGPDPQASNGTFIIVKERENQSGWYLTIG